jgi:hypothetical protein
MTTVEKKMKGLQDVADILTAIQNNGPQKVEGLDEIIGFDMGNDYEDRACLPRQDEGECGAACCIGGWLKALNPEMPDYTLERAVMAVSSLSRDQAHELCFPNTFSVDYARITPAMGVQAIANCLAGGWPMWNEVMNGGWGE